MRLIDADALLSKYVSNKYKDNILIARTDYAQGARDIIDDIIDAPTVEQTTGKWIPCSERLPEDLEPVNITWVNHNPVSYYAYIKDKPFTATGHYCNGRWWWYSAVCEEYLCEYGRCDADAMHDDIEVIAWMPLPKPWGGEE